MLVPFCGKHEIKLDLPEYSIVQYHLSRFTNLGLLEIAYIGRDNILQTLKFVLHVWPGICFDMDNIFFFSPPAEAFLSARPGGRRRQWPSWCLHLHAQAAAAARQPARPKAANGSGLPACTPRRRQRPASLPAQPAAGGRPVCKEPALSDVWCSKKEEGQKGYFTP